MGYDPPEIVPESHETKRIEKRGREREEEEFRLNRRDDTKVIVEEQEEE